jgi:pimeloyl-ACP methyl ester carboxylesterase
MCVRRDAPPTSGTRPQKGFADSAARALGATAAATVLCACASAYASFRSQADIPAYAELLRERDAVAVNVVRVEAGRAGETPLRLEVEERGTGDRTRVLVLVHGVLSDRRVWRFMTGPLGARCDLVLVDMPGSGGSDRPAPEELGPHGYDQDTLAAAVMAAVRDRLSARADSTRVTLVGHSLGSAVVMRCLASAELREEYADVLEHVDGAVLVSPPDWSYAKRDPAWERIADVSGLEMFVGGALGLAREAVAESILADAVDPAATPREEVDRVYGVLADSGLRTAHQSMLRGVIPFTEDRRADWSRIEEYEHDLARVDVPCLILTGGRDAAVPEALSFKLRQQLPHACLRVLPRAGHSVPVDRPREAADLVLRFVETRGEGWVAYEERAEGLPPTAVAARP